MKLGLGTVQFGLPYGIANRGLPVPEPAEVRRVLELAALAGVRVLDTSPEYGSSENVLGQVGASQAFRLFTKTPTGLRNSRDACGTLETTFTGSLARLGADRCEGLLIHNVDDLLSEEGSAIGGVLSSLKARGLVRKIGVSVYTPEELELVLLRFKFDVVQVPLNLFDQRFLEHGLLHAVKERGIEVHARSPFLQGLLLMETEQVPANLRSVASTSLSGVRLYAKKRGLSVLSLALSFVAAVPEIDCVLAGVVSRQQLAELLEAMETEVDPFELKQFASPDGFLIDPRRWGA